MPPAVSVIISNYNPKGHLLPCVERALALEGPPGTVEVLFPRHGLITAADEEALRGLADLTPTLRLLAGPFPNRAAALNAAAGAARGDLLVFIESHVLVPASLARDFRHAMSEANIVAVQGAFATASPGDWASAIENDLRELARRRRSARGLPPDEFNLHSTVIRREAFLAAGGFDEDLPGLAELLLFHRFHTAGQVRWIDHPVAEHINHSDWTNYLDALEHRGREVARLRMAHPEEGRQLYAIPLLDRNASAFLRWRWAMAGVNGLMWMAARAAFAAVHAVGPRSAELRVARQLAALTIRRGFLGALR